MIVHAAREEGYFHQSPGKLRGKSSPQTYACHADAAPVAGRRPGPPPIKVPVPNKLCLCLLLPPSCLHHYNLVLQNVQR
jgi:hypothetical protein